MSADDGLREAFLATSGEEAGPGDCPDPLDIWSAVDADENHPGAQTRALVLHAISCRDCRTNWALAVEMVQQAEAEGPPLAAEAHDVGEGQPWRRWWGPAAAAALIAIAATGMATREHWPGKYSAIETSTTFPAEGSVLIESLIPDDEPLSREKCVLRWSGPPGARYNVSVATEDLRMLASGVDLDSTEFVVQADRLSGVPAGARIVWQVEAVLREGGRTRSRTFLAQIE